jgi:16S rRNA pseudouridine516 synthase
MRLDKYLSFCGFGTRTEVKKLVKQGAMTVDGETVRDQAVHVKPGESAVMCNGEEARYREHVYVMLHKPEGVITATGDRWHETALDLLEGAYAERALFPVGRLDRDTTGLLLLTDDGPLAHELLAPKKHVTKVYEAVLDVPAEESDAAAFAAGIDLGDFTSLPAELAIRDGNRAAVSLSEGKFHQVRRMFEARGKTVLKLHRTAMGPLRLDENLAPGQWRELTADEVAALKNRSL